MGTSPRFHAPKAFSSFGLISASVVSPTTSSVAALGLNQVVHHLTMSSRVSFLTAPAVPEPESGWP